MMYFSKNKKMLVVVCSLILLVGLGFLVLSPKEQTQTTIEYTPFTADDTEAVENTVLVFGTQLKMVSLLAPKDVIDQDLETYYAKYITYPLLHEWIKDPSQAPGREVSSPYPDRIDIESVSIDNDAALVKAEIIEIVPDGDIVTRDPVVITLIREDGKWLIATLEYKK